MNNIRTQILQEASAIISGDRDQQYGKPEDCFADIAAHWTLHLRTRALLPPDATVTAADVGIMMVFLKAVRVGNDPSKRDSYVDGAGYFGCAAECALKPVDEDAGIPPEALENMYVDRLHQEYGMRAIQAIRAISDLPKITDANRAGQVHLVKTDGSIERVIWNAAGFHIRGVANHNQWAGWIPWNAFVLDKPEYEPDGTKGPPHAYSPEYLEQVKKINAARIEVGGLGGPPRYTPAELEMMDNYRGGSRTGTTEVKPLTSMTPAEIMRHASAVQMTDESHVRGDLHV